jgi:HAD superfamily hydrolase (TIGR01509 family)
MTLQAVIFDVDGTLADTEEAHRQAFNATFREFGLPWHWDVELYIELLAVAGGKERLRHYCRCVDPARLTVPDADTFIAGLHEHKTQAYNRRVAKGEVLARPGVIGLISELCEAGVRLAIATTTSRSNVDILLSTTLADLPPDTFEVIGAGEQAVEKKPAPDIYARVMAQLQLPAASCLAVEDSQNGVRAARGAGLPVLVTVNAWTRGEDFTGAAVVLEDLGATNVAALRLWHGGSA